MKEKYLNRYLHAMKEETLKQVIRILLKENGKQMIINHIIEFNKMFPTVEDDEEDVTVHYTGK